MDTTVKLTTTEGLVVGDSVVTPSTEESLEQKIARYQSADFRAALVLHFDQARKKAYDQLLSAGIDPAEIDNKKP
jgi:hypothetical protein